MQFPSVIDFYGIERFVLGKIMQDAIKPVSYKTRSDGGSRWVVSEFEIDLKPLCALGKQILKFGFVVQLFRLLFLGFTAGLFPQNFGSVLFSFSFLFSLCF